jgi:hypothetical protein
MALEREFRELCQRLDAMRTAMEDLSVCVRVDRPSGSDVAFLDTLADRTEDLSALLGEAADSAAIGHQASKHPLDPDRARLALGLCQDRFNALARRFASELATYDIVTDLAGAADERGGEWPGWVASVREELRRCQTLIDDVNQALLACWEDVAERAARGSIHVQSTSIGNVSGAGEHDRLAAG